MEGFGVGVYAMLIAVKSQQTKTDRCISLDLGISCLFLTSGPGRLVNTMQIRGADYANLRGHSLTTMTRRDTLCCICLGRCCLGLETREIIKISKNPC